MPVANANVRKARANEVGKSFIGNNSFPLSSNLLPCTTV